MVEKEKMGTSIPTNPPQRQAEVCDWSPLAVMERTRGPYWLPTPSEKGERGILNRK